jgi:DNA-binding Xre family transcriptional regulator
MIVVKLREAMERYRRVHGRRVTYSDLSAMTGLSTSTLEAIASRPKYHPNLSTIEKICVALKCNPGDLLEIIDEPGLGSGLGGKD